MPISFELTPANVADVSLTEELLSEATLARGGEEAPGGPGLPKREVEGGLGRGGHPPAHRAIRAAARGQAASGDCHLQPQEGIWPGETLATTLVGLATRIAAKIAAYTYAFVVNRMLGRPQGRIGAMCTLNGTFVLFLTICSAICSLEIHLLV